MNFQELKDKLIKLFQREIEIVKDIKAGFDGVNKDNLLFTQFLGRNKDADFGKMLESLEENLKMIDRSKRKCVTFGNTSNGKSAVLNALLQDDVFPSSCGRATSCFISVASCDDNNGYILDKDNKKCEIDRVKNFANAYSDDHYDIGSVIKMFWPRSKCDILKEDTEIWDSPGVDYSENHDVIIDKHCRDADVFLLVIDGESTLNQSEKRLFVSLKEKITIPSIIFLINKWDKIENNMNEKLRQQHMEKIKECFVAKLNLYNDKEIEERIFFVSAHNPSMRDKDGLIFDRLKERLDAELRTNALRNKIRGNEERVSDLSRIFSNVLNGLKQLIEKGQEDENNLKVSCQKIIGDSIEKITEQYKNIVPDKTSELAELIVKQIEDNNKWTLSWMWNNKFISVDLELRGPFISQMTACQKKELDSLEGQLREAFLRISSKETAESQIKEYFEKFVKFSELVQRSENGGKAQMTDFFQAVIIVFNEKEYREEEFTPLAKFMMKDFEQYLLSLGKESKETKNIYCRLKELKRERSEIKNPISSTLTETLNKFLTSHLNQTKSELEEKIEGCCDKYLKDKEELLNLWKKLERIQGIEEDNRELIELPERGEVVKNQDKSSIPDGQ